MPWKRSRIKSIRNRSRRKRNKSESVSDRREKNVAEFSTRSSVEVMSRSSQADIEMKSKSFGVAWRSLEGARNEITPERNSVALFLSLLTRKSVISSFSLFWTSNKFRLQYAFLFTFYLRSKADWQKSVLSLWSIKVLFLFFIRWNVEEKYFLFPSPSLNYLNQVISREKERKAFDNLAFHPISGSYITGDGRCIAGNKGLIVDASVGLHLRSIVFSLPTEKERKSRASARQFVAEFDEMQICFSPPVRPWVVSECNDQSFLSECHHDHWYVSIYCLS